MQEVRLPQVLTALLAGAALAGSGLVMQTLFANPLADPSLLGVNSGASLGAALVLLVFGGSLGNLAAGWGGALLTVAAAFAGACGVIALLLLCSQFLRGNLALLQMVEIVHAGRLDQDASLYWHHDVFASLFIVTFVILFLVCSLVDSYISSKAPYFQSFPYVF